ncbi:hypothetical protein [Nocardia brasiliensis]|uniref:Uncharacterized protein n=1 Tax=Nocardia brasiliensis (strain ATCC 700358 / HUJEG-1) TaxID=1133849 RepID=K0EP82_NOCB7|nr:hypothetical protein [Nocardia brasiliensis]AFT99246.1 hypothetical protein O3I_006420 [Nocardia brasiliensis ATCC 700358]OCF90265.1 hypothetical protein AW168_09690 [Nocardia brasiliensis]
MTATEQSEMQGMMTRWQALYKQADGGEFRLDEEVGTKLAQRAEQMQAKLRSLRNEAARLEHLSGFGSLVSAESLKNKFSLKANNGADSAVKRLEQSIDVVTLMRDTYKLACGKLAEADKSAADKLAGLDLGNS